MELVIVDVNGSYSYVWNFCTEENAKEELECANRNRLETIATYESHIVNFPKEETYWRNCKAEYENAKYEVMTYKEFKKRQRERFISTGITEITEEKYNEMLDVLPPLGYCTIGGVTMFCMREMYTDSYTTQYAQVSGKYYEAFVDVLDRRTWICERLKKAAV